MSSSEADSLIECVPVLLVNDLAAAIRHYHRLGFSIMSDEGDGERVQGYAYARRGGCGIQLAEAREFDIETNNRQGYMTVSDPTALAAEWRAAGIEGVYGPNRTSYGLEGTHVDPFYNVLRFGQPAVAPGSEFT